MTSAIRYQPSNAKASLQLPSRKAQRPPVREKHERDEGISRNEALVYMGLAIFAALVAVVSQILLG